MKVAFTSLAYMTFVSRQCQCLLGIHAGSDVLWTGSEVLGQGGSMECSMQKPSAIAPQKRALSHPEASVSPGCIWVFYSIALVPLVWLSWYNEISRSLLRCIRWHLDSWDEVLSAFSRRHVSTGTNVAVSGTVTFNSGGV